VRRKKNKGWEGGIRTRVEGKKRVQNVAVDPSPDRPIAWVHPKFSEEKSPLTKREKFTREGVGVAEGGGGFTGTRPPCPLGGDIRVALASSKTFP